LSSWSGTEPDVTCCSDPKPKNEESPDFACILHRSSISTYRHFGVVTERPIRLLSGNRGCGRPTLITALKKSDGFPHNELKKIAVTLPAIAAMAHTG
jgi:hypothetical protein